MTTTLPTPGTLRRVRTPFGDFTRHRLLAVVAVEGDSATVTDIREVQCEVCGGSGRRPLTFGSLFAGIGGLDLGFERGGWRCAWQVEINPYARSVLEKHWPNVRRHDDVRTFPVGPGWECDAIIGGFPCKQTSTAAAITGRRTGLAGPDSGLWFELLRVVRILRPSWVVVENVGGADSWKETIQSGLEDAGYRVSNRPLEVPAESVGAPHRRRRLFWIADVDGKGLEITRQGGPSEVDGFERRSPDRNSWLSSLAGVGRVDDGVPGGVDRRKRIEALGNAVVPQVAEFIARRIVAASPYELCDCDRGKVDRLVPLRVPTADLERFTVETTTEDVHRGFFAESEVG